MSPLLMQILLFFLVPVGICLLVFGIKLMRKFLYANMLLEISYQHKKGNFTVAAAGEYAVWMKGNLFLRRSPIDKFKPIVYNQLSGERISLTTSFSRVKVKNGRSGRTKLFTFYVQPGNYLLELVEGSSAAPLEGMFLKMTSNVPIDLTKYFIQVRKSQPTIYFAAGLILLILSGFFIIGGLVSGILVGQIN